jgi:hypothetical protein
MRATELRILSHSHRAPHTVTQPHKIRDAWWGRKICTLHIVQQIPEANVDFMIYPIMSIAMRVAVPFTDQCNNPKYRHYDRDYAASNERDVIAWQLWCHHDLRIDWTHWCGNLVFRT